MMVDPRSNNFSLGRPLHANTWSMSILFYIFVHVRVRDNNILRDKWRSVIRKPISVIQIILLICITNF